MKPIKTNKRELLHDCGPFLKVEQHEVEFPDGTIIPDWPWVVTPGFINLAAITKEGEFILFRQTKYAVEGTSLAPVGGYLDEGESPLLAAQRELREETGYAAAEWVSLGTFPVDANRGGATGHFFLALDAEFVGAGDSDDLEEQELLFLSESELREALNAGEFKVVSWIACMHMALAALAAKKN
jgi:ADP-ribose pyrophosphatase